LKVLGQPLLENNFVGRRISNDRLLGVDVNVGWHNRPGGMSDFKLLHQTSKENEKLLFCQRLTQAVSLAQSKWYYVFIMNKFSIFINKACWVKNVRIFKQIGVMHCMVKAAHDCSSLRDGKRSNLDIFHCVMWKSKVGQASHPHALQEDSAGIGHVVLVFQARKAIFANNLKSFGFVCIK
jgi:hypothetical protein